MQIGDLRLTERTVPPSPIDSPVSLVERAFALIDQEDWLAVAALCDPVSLRLFRREQLAEFSTPPSEPTLTVEQYRRHHPEMPLDVAAYHVAEHHRHLKEWRSNMGDRLAGVSTLADLEALSETEVFARFLEARSPRRQIATLVRRGQAPSNALELLPRRGSFVMRRERVVGAVESDGEFAFVVCRHTDDQAEWPSEMEAALADLTAEEKGLYKASLGSTWVYAVRRKPNGTWALLTADPFLGIGRGWIAEVRLQPPDGEARTDGDSEGHVADPPSASL